MKGGWFVFDGFSPWSEGRCQWDGGAWAYRRRHTSLKISQEKKAFETGQLADIWLCFHGIKLIFIQGLACSFYWKCLKG